MEIGPAEAVAAGVTFAGEYRTLGDYYLYSLEVKKFDRHRLLVDSHIFRAAVALGSDHHLLDNYCTQLLE